MTTVSHNPHALTSASPFCVSVAFSPWILADDSVPNRPSCRGSQGRVSSAKPPVREAFAFGRIHEAIETPQAVALDIPVVQSPFVGGKEGNKHEHKKLKAGRGSVGKTDSPPHASRNRPKTNHAVFCVTPISFAIWSEEMPLRAVTSEYIA